MNEERADRESALPTNEEELPRWKTATDERVSEAHAAMTPVENRIVPWLEELRAEAAKAETSFYLDTYRVCAVEILELEFPNGKRYFAKNGESIVPVGFVHAGRALYETERLHEEIDGWKKRLTFSQERVTERRNEADGLRFEVEERTKQVGKLRAELETVKGQRRSARRELSMMKKAQADEMLEASKVKPARKKRRRKKRG